MVRRPQLCRCMCTEAQHELTPFFSHTLLTCMDLRSFYPCVSISLTLCKRRRRRKLGNVRLCLSLGGAASSIEIGGAVILGFQRFIEKPQNFGGASLPSFSRWKTRRTMMGREQLNHDYSVGYALLLLKNRQRRGRSREKNVVAETSRASRVE